MGTEPYRVAETRPLARVVFWNDPKTTMAFVVTLLTDTFGLSEARANALAFAVHQDGWTDIGTYEQPEAEALVAQCLLRATELGFPFRATVASLGGEPRPTTLIRMRTRFRAWLDPTRPLRVTKPVSAESRVCPRCGTSSAAHRVLEDALVCTACHRSFPSDERLPTQLDSLNRR